MGTDLAGGRVLVVDDDRVNRMLLTRSLEHEGHRVRCAENGAKALELLHDDPCDVVLLDIVMPELDGVSVLEHVKGDPALQDVPVIMISGVDDTEAVVVASRSALTTTCRSRSIRCCFVHGSALASRRSASTSSSASACATSSRDSCRSTWWTRSWSGPTTISASVGLATSGP